MSRFDLPHHGPIRPKDPTLDLYDVGEDNPIIQLIEAQSSKEGIKHDSEKSTRPELIPPEAVEALGTILAFGAKKYADRNWELGMDWGRVFGAGMRHLWAWWKGEDKDLETGYSHLWHALTCIAFLVTYEQRGIGKDSRK